MKKLLNLQEEATHEKLERVCSDWGARVFAKPRVADVLPIEGSGISSTAYGYALRAHFDFVVADEETKALFAVEFDGPSHASLEAQKKDTAKDELCAKFGLPILRINSRHLLRRYRQLDLLTWIVEVWFLEREFDRAQERGDIPWDEGFDPIWLSGPLGSKTTFPLWLSLGLKDQFRKLAEAGKIAEPVPTMLVGSDEAGNTRAIASLMIDGTCGVVGRTAARRQQFPFPIDQLVEELAVFELHGNLQQVLVGKALAISADNVDSALRAFAARYKVRMWMGYVPRLARIRDDVVPGG